MENFITSYRAVLCGYTGSPAEMSFTPTGREVTNVSVAFGGGDGRKGTFVKLAFWENSAKIANEVLDKKGMAVMVEGRPGVNAWIGKEGQAVGRLTLNVFKLTIFDKVGARQEIDLEREAVFAGRAEKELAEQEEAQRKVDEEKAGKVK